MPPWTTHVTSQNLMSRRRSLSDTLATLPNLSDKIVKLDDQFCEAGGFSDVYKCKHSGGAGQVQVAVKSFRFPFTLDETGSEEDGRRGVSRKMIRRELGIWRRLEHPNIVPFLGITYGFGRQGNASIVSLWMANGTLGSFVGEHDDRLTTAHRLKLLLDTANGLRYLHSLPVIHGDLSGNNVLLDHNYNACLTDFGYASMPEAAVYLQVTTMKPGTIRWAAPEHCAADTEETAQPTTKSDIYSFGNLGLLVLSGKQPWSEIRREAAVVLQLARGNKPQRPSSPSIEDSHWELIQRCWSSIDDRPTAEDVVSSLQQFLHSFPPPTPLLDVFCVVLHSNVARNLDNDPENTVPSSTVADESQSSVGLKIEQDLSNTTAHSGSTEFLSRLLSKCRIPPFSFSKRYTERGVLFLEDGLLPPPTRHVVFIGETGSGKSSIINLIAGKDIAAVASDVRPRTNAFASYEVSLDGQKYQLWDTPGLAKTSSFFWRKDHSLSLKSFLAERRGCRQLDLLVLCVRAGRASQGVSRVYEAFCRTTRQTGIPVVVAVTHLEKTQPTMESWWQENEVKLGNLGLLFDGHACLTCVSPQHRRWASQAEICALISTTSRR